MYQGRNFDHVDRLLLIAGGAADRARYEGLLFLGRRTSLRQTFETLEGIIDEYPVLVYYFAILRHRRGRCNNVQRFEYAFLWKFSDVVSDVSNDIAVE